MSNDTPQLELGGNWGYRDGQGIGDLGKDGYFHLVSTWAPEVREEEACLLRHASKLKDLFWLPEWYSNLRPFG